MTFKEVVAKCKKQNDVVVCPCTDNKTFKILESLLPSKKSLCYTYMKNYSLFYYGHYTEKGLRNENRNIIYFSLETKTKRLLDHVLGVKL